MNLNDKVAFRFFKEVDFERHIVNLQRVNQAFCTFVGCTKLFQTFRNKLLLHCHYMHFILKLTLMPLFKN